MMPDKNRIRRINLMIELATYVAIMLAFVSLSYNLERFSRLAAQDQQMAGLYTAQTQITERIHEAVNRKELFARGIAAAVALRPNISEQEFARLSSGIQLEDPSVVNMALVRDKFITHVYPEEENLSLIGRDLRDVPRQSAVLDRIARTGKSALDGPISLLQGYAGFILREPVFLLGDDGDTGQFWAVASIVFDKDTFLGELGLDDFSKDYQITIRAHNMLGDERTIYGDNAVFARNPAVQQLRLPSSIWTIALVPAAGWDAVPAQTERNRMLTGIAMIVTLAMAWYLNRLRAANWRSAAQLRAAVNVLQSGFVLFDRNDRLQICNERYREIHGPASDAVVKGATFESILREGLRHGLYPDATGHEEAWLGKHLARGDHKASRFELELSNGHWLQILEQETPTGGRVAVLNDITELLHSRQRAQLAEQRLFDAIDALPVGFWLFDAEDRLIMFNRVAGNMLPGMQRALKEGRNLAELVERRAAISKEMLIGGRPAASPHEILDNLHAETSELEVCYDGDLWFRYYTRRTSENGLVMFRIELTDLRRHQRQIETSNTELRAALAERDAAESRFRDVADISTEWFWEQDEHLQFTYLSEGFRRAMGRDPADFIGCSRVELLVEPDGSPEAENLIALRQTMERHEPFKDVVYSYRFHPDRESWIRTSGKPVFAKDGSFRGYIGTAADVTQFYAALRRAEQADEAKTQFLNIISHELRTPLTVVTGFNSFIYNSDRLPSYVTLHKLLEAQDNPSLRRLFDAYRTDIRSFSDRIRNAGVQLQTLIDDMLDLARIEANTMRIETTRVDSLRVTQSVLDQMQSMAAEKHLELRCEMADLPIAADEMRFRQILTNLLGNALKFTDHGSITVRNERQGDMVVFRVEDTGIGISHDKLSIIFDRFAQVNEGTGTTRRNQGVGLGLAICKDLTRLQGGWIRAESRLGQGSTLIFALPAWKDA